MAEILRVTGKNTIAFDVTGGNYPLNAPPTGLSKVLTRREVISALPRLPLGIRPHVLKYGLSTIIFDFNIWDTTDPLMEDREHDLLETLYEGQIYIESWQKWGQKVELQYKSDGVANTSYKTVFYGVLDELEARDPLGARAKEHFLEGLRLTLYCEPGWHANAVTNLVSNVTLHNHDDAAHNNYVDIAGANIGGDMPSPIYLRVFPVEHHLRTVRTFARHKGTIANFISAYEGEGASGRSNWGDLGGDANASNAEVVGDGAAATGYVYWTVAANKPDQEGTFNLFARVWTDDKDNTYFRARLTNAAGENRQVGEWKVVDEDSVWKFIDLGQFEIETPYGLTRQDWRWYVDYAKPTAATVRLDWLFVAPVKEGIALLLDIPEAAVPVADVFTWRGTHDFVEAYHYDPGGSEYIQPLTPRGFVPEPALIPQKATRLLFSVDTESAGGLNQNDVHEGGDERFTVYVDYLPQYISPLE